MNQVSLTSNSSAVDVEFDFSDCHGEQYLYSSLPLSKRRCSSWRT